MTGVTTNTVTAVEIRERNTNDSKMLPDLVNATAAHFAMREVSADKQYASVNNFAVIDSHGATPYIPFRADHKGRGGGLWGKLFHFYSFNRYSFNRDEFLRHYHKRSNAETTFSMIKGKFGDAVRSKTDTAMTNEVLCKVLAHNVCVLIQSMYELGIEPTFWAEPARQAV